MDNSPLTLLPAELRNNISELASYHGDIPIVRFQSGIPIFWCHHQTVEIPGTAWRTCRHHLALAQTCRQLRRETFKLFFAINTFTMCDNNSSPRNWLRVDRLLEQLPPTVGQGMQRLIVVRDSTQRWDGPELDFREMVRELRRPGMRWICLRYLHTFRALDDLFRWQEVKLEIDGGAAGECLEKALGERQKMPKELVRVIEELLDE